MQPRKRTVGGRGSALCGYRARAAGAGNGDASVADAIAVANRDPALCSA